METTLLPNCYGYFLALFFSLNSYEDLQTCSKFTSEITCVSSGLPNFVLHTKAMEVSLRGDFNPGMCVLLCAGTLV